MKNIFPDFALKQLGLFVAIIVIFFYNVVLDRDYECNCEERCSDCIVYMALPSGIIFVLQLWMDKTFIYTCDISTCKSCCKGCCYVVYHVIKAVFVSLLWVTSVLIDGDWYVCCEINQSEQQKLLACKEKNNRTAEERTTIAELKNHSRLWGMILLLGIVIVAAVGSSIGRKKSCGRPCCTESPCCCTDSGCCYTNILYEEVKLDEEENVLKEIMKKEAKAEVTERLENYWQQTKVEGEWVPHQVCLSPTGNQSQHSNP
ncbi:uncharacterized protein LOC116059181 [Sander lucioperca]|uniref:uncharacterized protein LOC116059181 n=1 Tax=Sander lucioperca TaxID=283035 RepID=UPI00125DEC19|nr:uncharacterized protein LOC116059181 [Sander lucioperca]